MASIPKITERANLVTYLGYNLGVGDLVTLINSARITVRKIGVARGSINIEDIVKLLILIVLIIEYSLIATLIRRIGRVRVYHD